jgi:O-6-methylguanine DNA methyltransferase
MGEVLCRTAFDTPLGTMIGVASDRGLCGLEFEWPNRLAGLMARLRRWSPACEVVDRRVPALDTTGHWLAGYFSGSFSDTPPASLDLCGTEFERAVWHALLGIRTGTTTTYGEIARQLGRPKGARAVGLAVGANPIGLIVPCHRVIGQNGSLTGYGGGLDRKQWLLRHEGVLLPNQ